MDENGIGRREFLSGMSAFAVGMAARNSERLERFREGHGMEKRLATFCCDVTPPLGTPIYSGYKPLEVIEQPLLAKGVVLDDGEHRYVLCCVDWCEICNSTHTLFRRSVAEATGADLEHVAIQTVHQHTAPMGDIDTSKLLESLNSPPPHTPSSFFEESARRVARAAKDSLAGLRPFDNIGTGQAKVDRVASNRRVPIGDGKVGFRGSSCKDPKLREMPEGMIDPMVKTITFASGQRPLARLHYYATHPQSFYGDPRASYDFPGMAREKLQEEEGVFQIYFTGCAGDIAAGKYNDGSPGARDELFQRLYAGMAASASSTTYVRAERFEWRRLGLELTPREDGAFSEAQSRARMQDEKAAVLARHDGATVLAFQARRHAPLELSALQIGGVRILHLPGEMMIDYQLFAQQLRPNDFVAVAAYGDCGPGYVCLERSFGEGGYEPTASLVVPGSEGPMRDAIRRLLDVK